MMRAIDAQATPARGGARPAGAAAPLLSLAGVRMSFGGIVAVQDVGFDVMPGTVHALIGPNGAGKTTMLNCISRFYTPQQGRMVLRTAQGEHDLLRLKAHQISRLGIARTFQNLALFAELTVFDNVLIARSQAMRATLAEALLNLPRQRREERAERERVQALLEELRLAPHAHTLVRDLPYGTQKLVELARAMALEPVLMLLDEPAAGMNATETGQLKLLIEQIRRDGITVMLIEHDVKLVMGLCDRVAVLDFGKKIAEDIPTVVQKDEAVIAAYLGGGKHAD